MAFVYSDLARVAAEINDRKTVVERLALVEITPDESYVLRGLVASAIQSNIESDSAGLIILVFAFYLLKNQHHYLQENSFWQQFEEELGIPENHERVYLYEQFSRSFERHGINLLRSGNRRQFVLTIREELENAEEQLSVKRQQAMEFFRWYFNLKQPVEIEKKLLQRYTQETRRTFMIADQAIPSLRRECEVITRILDWGEESNLLFTQIGWDELCMRVVSELGTNYNLRSIRLLTSQESLLRLLLLLQNHCTPSQFRLEVERVPLENVITADGRRFSGRNFLSTFNADKTPFGDYVIGSTTYHVVPYSWLRYEDIAQWHWAKTISPRSSWIGYRKKDPFYVDVNGNRISSQLFFTKREQFFIWVGRVTSGIPLKIDGHHITQSEGITWDSTLGVLEDKLAGAKLAVLITKLQINYPKKPNAPFSILTSEGVEKWYKLDSSGNRQLYRDIALPLDNFTSSITVTIDVDTYSTKKEFPPSAAYLFSTQTLIPIPTKGIVRHAGRFFWLFCKDDSPQYDSEILELVETNYFSPYHVFKVSWVDGSRPFELKVGQLEWKIEQQQYFDLWLLPHTPLVTNIGECNFSLAPHQYFNLDKPIWGISTNLPLQSQQEENTLRCQWIRENEILFDESVEKVIRSSGGSFQFLKEFWARLQATLTSLCHYATTCTLRFYLTPVNSSNKITIAESRITILPIIKVFMPQLISSNENLPLRFSSSRSNLWNSDCSKWDKESETVIALQTHVKPIIDDYEDKEIAITVSKVLSTNIRIKGVDNEESLSVLSRPFVWSVMLWERPLSKNDNAYGDYYQSHNLNFYGLPHSCIAFSTYPHALVSLRKAKKILWEENANQEGILVLKNLTVLQEYCSAYSTYIEASSGIKTTTIQIIQAPRLITVSFLNDEKQIEIVFTGPFDAQIKAIFVKDNESQSLHLFQCNNNIEKVKLDLPNMEFGSMWRLDIAFEIPSTLASIPITNISLNVVHSTAGYSNFERWVAIGLGVSSYELITNPVLPPFLNIE